jgi:hypothetical protein
VYFPCDIYIFLGCAVCVWIAQSSAGPRFDVDMSFSGTSWYNGVTFPHGGCFGVADPEDFYNPQDVSG